MAEKRTLLIESSPGNTLSVQVGADLVDRFVHTTADKGGSWRKRRKSGNDSP